MDGWAQYDLTRPEPQALFRTWHQITEEGEQLLRTCKTDAEIIVQRLEEPVLVLIIDTLKSQPSFFDAINKSLSGIFKKTKIVTLHAWTLRTSIAVVSFLASRTLVLQLLLQVLSHWFYHTFQNSVWSPGEKPIYA